MNGIALRIGHGQDGKQHWHSQRRSDAAITIAIALFTICQRIQRGRVTARNNLSFGQSQGSMNAKRLQAFLGQKRTAKD
jgi:hypothetical protein